jgi:hypothetical protein
MSIDIENRTDQRGSRLKKFVLKQGHKYTSAYYDRVYCQTQRKNLSLYLLLSVIMQNDLFVINVINI